MKTKESSLDEENSITFHVERLKKIDILTMERDTSIFDMSSSHSGLANDQCIIYTFQPDEPSS